MLPLCPAVFVVKEEQIAASLSPIKDHSIDWPNLSQNTFLTLANYTSDIKDKMMLARPHPNAIHLGIIVTPTT